MALTSTVHVFDLSISDMDRGVYESLSLKLARHPSETAEFMLTRVLAYALEYQEGLAFSGGLSVTDEPALWVRDLTGQLQAWIEVGTPDAARLHKATKAVERVVVYCHKDLTAWFRAIAGQKVYEAERVHIVEIDRRFIAAAAEKVEKRTALSVSRTEGELYLDLGGASFTTTLRVHPLPTA